MKKILIADDHSFIRMGLIQIIKDEYPTAVIGEAEDASALINKVTQEDWDLVISDLDMPGRSGLEALEQIKLLKPELPVLILSIYSEELYAVRALKAGASGYLNKNAAPYDLVKAMERIFIGRKYITPELAEQLLVEKDVKYPHKMLTNRELEIFRLLAEGRSNNYIAEQLSLATTTISTYRTRILEKMKMSSNSEMALYAVQHGLINRLPE